MAFERFIPMETLKAKESLNEDEKLELFLYEQKEKIDRANKNFELGIYLLSFFVFGGGFTFYGFHHWHTKIQPKQDRFLDLQIKKLENDVKAFNK